MTASDLFDTLSGCNDCPAKALCDGFLATDNDPDCIDILEEYLYNPGSPPTP